MVKMKNWNQLTLEWRAAKEVLDRAAAAEAEAREALIKLHPEGFTGNDLTLELVPAYLRCAYKDVVNEMLPNLDLTKWQKMTKPSYRIHDGLAAKHKH